MLTDKKGKEYEMKESAIEKYFKYKVEKYGGWCLKWTSPGQRGVPDRICIFKNDVYFAELKTEDGEPSPLQRWVHRKLLERFDRTVFTIHTIEQVDQFITYVVLKEAGANEASALGKAING